MANLPANKRVSGATKAVSSLTPHAPLATAPLEAVAPQRAPVAAKPARNLGNGITALLITFLGSVLFLSLMSYDPTQMPGEGGNWMGAFGTHVASILLHLLGLGAFLLAGVVTSIGALLLVGVHVEMKPSEFVGQMFFVTGGSVCFHLLMLGDKVLGHMPGGAVGAMGGEVGRSFFGDVGVWLVAGMAAGGGLLLAADTSVGRILERIFQGVRALFGGRRVTAGPGVAEPQATQATQAISKPAAPAVVAVVAEPKGVVVGERQAVGRLKAVSAQLQGAWQRLRARPEDARALPQAPVTQRDQATPAPPPAPVAAGAAAVVVAPPAPTTPTSQAPSAQAKPEPAPHEAPVVAPSPVAAESAQDTLPPVSASFETARHRVASILAKLPAAGAPAAEVKPEIQPSKPAAALSAWNPSARAAKSASRRGPESRPGV